MKEEKKEISKAAKEMTKIEAKANNDENGENVEIMKRNEIERRKA